MKICYNNYEKIEGKWVDTRTTIQCDTCGQHFHEDEMHRFRLGEEREIYCDECYEEMESRIGNDLRESDYHITKKDWSMW